MYMICIYIFICIYYISLGFHISLHGFGFLCTGARGDLAIFGALPGMVVGVGSNFPTIDLRPTWKTVRTCANIMPKWVP